MDETTEPLTIRLSRHHLGILRSLAEIYHATPERLVESWAVYEIERRDAEMRGGPASGVGTGPGVAPNG